MIVENETFLPLRRPRRNRSSEAIRNLVQETKLSVHDLVAPLFILEGTNLKTPIDSLPGLYRYSIDLAVETAKKLYDQGICALALFPYIERQYKDEQGSMALHPENLVIRASAAIKAAVPKLCLIADVALDPYTSHGHDGLVFEEQILNDETVEVLSKMALLQAQAGIDMVAPSDMMDGRVKSIRQLLDNHGFTHTGILAYSVKYASAFYGPFREAVGSSLSFGDKKTYQMNPANAREALLEAALDEEEGADMLMVKPASLYLDVIASLRKHSHLPIAAYHVSGEYACVAAAAEKGWINKELALLETLTAIKRAGADMIFTYAAAELAPKL